MFKHKCKQRRGIFYFCYLVVATFSTNHANYNLMEFLCWKHPQREYFSTKIRISSNVHKFFKIDEAILYLKRQRNNDRHIEKLCFGNYFRLGPNEGSNSWSCTTSGGSKKDGRWAIRDRKAFLPLYACCLSKTFSWSYFWYFGHMLRIFPCER